MHVVNSNYFPILWHSVGMVMNRGMESGCKPITWWADSFYRL